MLSLQLLNHCLRIQRSWRMRTQVSSSVSSCDASRAPFCSFYSFSVSFSFFFRLPQIKSWICCVSSSSSFSSPHHSTRKRISFLIFSLCSSFVCVSLFGHFHHHVNLYDVGHLVPFSHYVEQAHHLHSPQCWCCLHPEQCPSGGQLGQSFGTQMSNGPDIHISCIQL